jgi:uncharacterized lipoprotein YehR (DUF1307 family)
MIIAIMALTLVFGVTGCTSKPEESTSAAKSGVEKNYGLAYQSGTINVDESNPKDAFDAADVVPDENTLTTNLEGKGYDIEKTETVFDSDINATTISAKKINSFCVITYCLDQTEAEKVFEAYEKKYNENDYYIMAQNGAFVYCTSDDNSFKDAGFTGFANSGTQFINHDNFEAR